MPKPAIKVVKPRNISISQSLGYSSQALGYLSQALGYSSQALGYSFGGGKNKFYSGGGEVLWWGKEEICRLLSSLKGMVLWQLQG